MANKFGLGRGLSDLKQEMGAIPDISVLTGGGRLMIRQIPLVQIGANPDQPRKTFDADELADLAASIREKGVLQPILLRTAGENAPHKYEIVAGERRFRASQMAGLSEIPALVKDLTPENAMEIALIENVQRENLNPMEEAAAYQNIMEKCGYEIADVSRLIGKSDSYIRNIMRLLSLPASVGQLVASGQLSASHARAIVVAENPEQLAHKIIADNMSAADAAKLAKSAPRAGRVRAFTAKTLDASELDKMCARVAAAIGTDVQIQERRGGAGRIVLAFKSRPQLYELIDRLAK